MNDDRNNPNATLTQQISPEFYALEKPKKKSFTITPGVLIAALSALILLFSIIVTVAVILINYEVTPKPNDSGIIGDGKPTAIAEYRDRPVIETNKIPDPEQFSAPSIKSTCEPITSIISSQAILVDLNENSIVGLKGNTAERVSIASMTKIMTLIVACDYISEYDGENALWQTVKLTYNEALLSGYSCAFVTKGAPNETVYVYDMLYGLILESGADCAYGLAEFFAGSEAEFVRQMNKKAKAIGMNNTNFTSCVGKDDGGANYSSTLDVATMFSYALQNELCYKIFTTANYTCVGRYNYQTLTSLVHKNTSTRAFGKITFLGGKSGSETDSAGKYYYCLASLGQTADGHKYICITAGHPTSSYADTEVIYKNYIS